MIELPPLGTRVRVRLLRSPACHAHDQANVPTDGMEGVVERLNPDLDHPIVVGFDLWCRGTRWYDYFRPGELVVLDI
jgi:hypothetical protein